MVFISRVLTFGRVLQRMQNDSLKLSPSPLFRRSFAQILSSPEGRTMPESLPETEMIKLSDSVYVRVYTYEGYLLVDMRRVWRRDGYSGIFPTKQGVCIRDTWWNELKTNFPLIEESLKKVMDGGAREELLICGNEKNGLFVTADETYMDNPSGFDIPSMTKRVDVDIRKCRVDMENNYTTKGIRLNLLEWSSLNKNLDAIDEKLEEVKEQEM